MVLMSIRNHVRVDIRFWLFHDGDGRTRSSSWSNPLHLVERQRDSISLLSSLCDSRVKRGNDRSPKGQDLKGLGSQERGNRPNMSTHRTLRHLHSYPTSHIDKQLTKLASMGGERERGASSGSNG